MNGIRITEFEPGHAAGIAILCRRLDWPSFSDPAVVRQACTAPGVNAYVALDGAEVVGFAQACGDGVVQSHLSQLAVARTHRRRGIASALVERTFRATATRRMDLVTEDAHEFYRSFAHKEMPGFRIYPGADGSHLA